LPAPGQADPSQNPAPSVSQPEIQSIAPFSSTAEALFNLHATIESNEAAHNAKIQQLSNEVTVLRYALNSQKSQVQAIINLLEGRKLSHGEKQQYAAALLNMTQLAAGGAAAAAAGGARK